MDNLLYYFVRGILALIQAPPLTWVARMGRCLGGVAYYIDARHRRVAIRNLTMCFGTEKTPVEIRALARENFRRIGESYLCALKTASMTLEQLKGHMELVGTEKARDKDGNEPQGSVILAIGHFGNFELYARIISTVSGYRGATTYRALKGRAFNRLLLELRERSGCLFFERRTEGAALREALRTQRLVLGLLSDQHAGDHGARLPFFGHDCSTTKAPAVFALRFHLPLHTAICYRTSPAHWRVEIGEEIPTHENGHPRTSEAIMLDVNRAFETAVRRDPANWFWVHKRWKPAPPRRSPAKPPPEENIEPGENMAPEERKA